MYFAIAELALVAVYLEKHWSGGHLAARFWVPTGAMAFAGLVFGTPALIKNIKRGRIVTQIPWRLRWRCERPIGQNSSRGRRTLPINWREIHGHHYGRI
jgi:hypothetical protein